MCIFLVPQDSLSVEVQSLQLLDQMALSLHVLATLFVQGVHFCKLTTADKPAQHVQ